MAKSMVLFMIAAIALLPSCDKDDDTPYYGGGVGNPPPGNLSITTMDDMTFSPSTLNAKVGDEILFYIGAGHSATKVSEATWQANEATSDGGFDFEDGTYSYILQSSDIGTIYYVCKFHVDMGMKGMIIVADTTAIL